jgi:hypothetical protein
MTRTDYAINCGWQDMIENGGGPSSLSAGDAMKTWGSEACNGISYQVSQVRMKAITRGTSNVYLIGERYMNPDNYYTGQDPADNESMFVGFDNDLYRSSITVPMFDRKGLSAQIWGSNHFAGIFMAYCDGSVRLIEYGVNAAVFKDGGNRNLK